MGQNYVSGGCSQSGGQGNPSLKQSFPSDNTGAPVSDGDTPTSHTCEITNGTGTAIVCCCGGEEAIGRAPARKAPDAKKV
jgi:hypothetical protein